ncbi:MAG: phosphatidylserine/phosphatidylglycerophosphate/cardiolipin synthase family protein [Candidatus Onthomonas sp.]
MSRKIRRPVTPRRVLGWLLRGVGALLLCFFLAITVPYAWNHPEVSQEYIDQVSAIDFRDQAPGLERVKLLTDNQEALEERIRLISGATERVIYASFDLRLDNSGQDVLALLLDASRRGVQVQLLLDGLMPYTQIGNWDFFRALAAQPNVELCRYNPPSLLRPLEFHGRMHDKYVIVDETAYLLGGRNTYDYFLGDYPTSHPSHDLELLVYNTQGDDTQGSMAQVLDYFRSVWNLESTVSWFEDESLLEDAGVQEAVSQLEDRFQWLKNTYPEAFQPVDYEAETQEAGAIHLVSNPVNPQVKEPHVLYTMTQLLSSAEEEVLFQSPYVVCNDVMYDDLERIVSAVPSVTLLVNNVVTGENIMASSDYLRSKGAILETGVTLYEYAVINNHSKCAVIDDDLAVVGSFNWDMRSAYLDTELMLVVASPELNQSLRDYTQSLLAESRLCVDENTYETPPGITAPKMPAAKGVILGLLQIVTIPLRSLL